MKETNQTKYIQMHTKNGDQICSFLLTGVLEENGKAVPSNYEATDFWPEILYIAKMEIKYEDRLKSFSDKNTQIYIL